MEHSGQAGGCTTIGIVTAEKIVFIKIENPASLHTWFHLINKSVYI